MGTSTSVLSASQVLREIVARAGASACFPLHGLEIAPFWTHKPTVCQQASERGPEAPEDRLGAQGAEFPEREVHQQQVWAKRDEEAVVLVAARSDRSAIWRRQAPTCPTAPEESDSLLWTLSGGLSPPPVLGAGAARTTSTRCICPPSPPPPSLTHPQPTAPRCARCLTRFCAALRSPCSRFSVPKNTSNMVWRSSSSFTIWSAGHLAGLPVLGRRGAWTAIGPCVHVCHPGTLPASFLCMWTRKC